MKTEQYENAKRVLAHVLGINASLLRDDSGMHNTVEWDSLAHLRLVLHVEGVIGRKINIDEILGIVDLKSISILLDS